MPRFAITIIAGALLLGACANGSRYAGVDLRSGAANSDLQSLARRAQAGDKHAQLELGIRYEEGRGVSVDLKRARMLYEMAAADSGGTTWVYSPPVGNGTSGRVIPIESGRVEVGLPEARLRLLQLGSAR